MSQTYRFTLTYADEHVWQVEANSPAEAQELFQNTVRESVAPRIYDGDCVSYVVTDEETGEDVTNVVTTDGKS